MGAFKHKKRFAQVFYAALFLIIACTLWENVSVGVTYYRVESERLPRAFDGYKIVVVSDLHNAKFGERNNQVINLIKKEKPDLIAITGDLIDSRRLDMGVALELTQQLTDIASCYYVTGNHESRIGQSLAKLEAGLSNQGVTLLRNRVVHIEHQGQTLQIAGIDDPEFVDSDSSIHGSVMQSKIEGLGLSSKYCILLSHRPEAFDVYADEGLDLVLSGHAHGGQIRLPIIGGLIAPNQGLFPNFDAGVYTKHHTTMVLSRGIGNSLLPIRFNNRPEIVSIELKCS